MYKESAKVVQSILDRYEQRTKASKSHDALSKNYLPGGDTRAGSYFSPYPAYMEKGRGCYLYDCDENEYIDFLNNYTSLIHGHAYQPVTEAARIQLENGTVLGSPSEKQYKHAEHLCSRIPSIEMIRYCNSGTEATLLAMRAARAFAGKDVIIKMDGGYHGSHDFVEINVYPYPSPEKLPTPRLNSRGVPACVLNETLVAPFNDLNAIETILKKHKDKIAAVILEPMLGVGGNVPPRDGYLSGLRELSNKYDVLLIFDEIMTFRLSLGGLQAISDVEPDLTALGKIIGGGFPIGAFGGKKEIMMQFDFENPDCLFHTGTFNGNNITMAAGLAAMQFYNQNAINRINKLGDQLREGFNDAFKKVGIKGQATGLGSVLTVHWGEREITNAKDTAIEVKSAAELPKLLHLEMMNRGIFSASRAMFAISTPMTEREIDEAVETFEGSLAFLKPYVAEVTPQLLRD